MKKADTRLLLHAKHASQTYENIVISTPDTDVFMIALAKSLDINAELYILTGTKNARRIINITAVAENINHSFNKTSCDKSVFLNALLGFHCFTGCDSISAFAGRRKVKPLMIMCKTESYVAALSILGKYEDFPEESFIHLETFVCHMYGKVVNEAQQCGINHLRYSIYCQRGGKIPIEMLPPCRDVLKQHVMRSNYQTYVWRKSLEAFMSLNNPENYGWYINEEKMDVLWMTCNPAPDEVYLQFL